MSNTTAPTGGGEVWDEPVFANLAPGKMAEEAGMLLHFAERLIEPSE